MTLFNEHIVESLFKELPNDIKKEITTGLDAIDSGDMYIDAQNIIKHLNSDYICIVEDLDAEVDSHPFVLYKKYLFTQKHWEYERCIAHEMSLIIKKNQMEQPLCSNPPCYDNMLTSEQRLAVEMFLGSQFSLLCGGPGRGKTFTVQCGITAYKEVFPAAKIAITAPTGRAAQLLAEKIKHLEGVESMTLHSLLSLRDNEKSLYHPVPLHFDCIVVDEASMIDVRVFTHLFSRIGNAKVLIVGDDNQLPPVEAGTFFHEIIHAAYKYNIPFTRLSKSMRVSNSYLLSLHEAVCDGNHTLLIQLLNERKKLHNISEAGDVIDRSLSLFSNVESIEECFAVMRQFRILTSHNNGIWGTTSLNSEILSSIEEIRENKPIFLPVQLTKNLSHYGLFNGAEGVKCIRDGEETWHFKNNCGDVFEYGKSIDRHTKISYAITIHKSQGSEYDECALILQEGTELFGRESIYTGISRGKNDIQIFSTTEVIEKTLLVRVRRSTLFQERLSYMLTKQQLPF